MSIKQKQVLLFDLDGTLVDSAPDIALAVNSTLKDLNKPAFDENTIRQWVGNGAKALIERALSGSTNINKELDRTVVEDTLAIFLRHYQQCICVNSVLYYGVKEGLLTLKKAGFRLGIITNKPEKLIQPILSGLGIGDMFEILIGGDTLPEKKPNPAPLLLALKQLDVTADQCLMIGDSKNDILAAKAANIDSVGFTYGYNYGEDIAQYNPQWCFNTFPEFTSAAFD
ncbi:phosphoglycolate phosphatase [Colwellia sp. 4_MG-2023]|uniref:phosphoglycolate phosphatase n=1 Tax=unclassified Colwellia TaxID=196834 RepID=UPI001C0A1940|nr:MULTISPECIES: phosphoglycolate phosphatase [unclassified Colwellia]MBU2924408.1 phosphoglycolate phosphatase [Colwellia sp. C2M11]MDO6505367.1 phosphoglycolate phosphatase [Colwellia sp. 5_MG-2023]MDO6554337.1 phosphoglycolate phosphatase [Colwellia sp. 4_MG-2023]MDO6650790.1 phosphoglycolate phosphatase [Colwellia sp. 3_MG-2023]MDO6663825.1 phosphoglycolate phosphatase [Colwellia sp. 2_MG-2023]